MDMIKENNGAAAVLRSVNRFSRRTDDRGNSCYRSTQSERGGSSTAAKSAAVVDLL